MSSSCSSRLPALGAETPRRHWGHWELKMKSYAALPLVILAVIGGVFLVQLRAAPAAANAPEVKPRASLAPEASPVPVPVFVPVVAVPQPEPKPAAAPVPAVAPAPPKLPLFQRRGASLLKRTWTSRARSAASCARLPLMWAIG
jgi:hypothetical protein